SICALLRAPTTTSQPSPASERATPAPIPRPPPVISALTGGTLQRRWGRRPPWPASPAGHGELSGSDRSAGEPSGCGDQSLASDQHADRAGGLLTSELGEVEGPLDPACQRVTGAVEQLQRRGGGPILGGVA